MPEFFGQLVKNSSHKKPAWETKKAGSFWCFFFSKRREIVILQWPTDLFRYPRNFTTSLPKTNECPLKNSGWKTRLLSFKSDVFLGGNIRTFSPPTQLSSPAAQQNNHCNSCHGGWALVGRTCKVVMGGKPAAWVDEVLPKIDSEKVHPTVMGWDFFNHFRSLGLSFLHVPTRNFQGRRVFRVDLPTD